MCLFLQAVTDELERHKGLDRFHDVRAAGSVEQYANGLPVAFFHLEHHLTAGTARRNGFGVEMAVGESRNGDGLDRLVGVLVLGVEDGGALGAHAQRIGGVLLIAARDDGAVLETQGGTHPEAGIGAVTLFRGFLGQFHKFAVFCGEFMVLINADLTRNLIPLHDKSLICVQRYEFKLKTKNKIENSHRNAATWPFFITFVSKSNAYGMKSIARFLLLLVFCLSPLALLRAQHGIPTYVAYIKQYHRMAQEQMLRYRIPASITLAQGLLESGAGQSDLARRANNHFGIKVAGGWTGTYVVKSDDRPDDKFRKYSCVEESYEDHSKFLQKPRYACLFELSPTDYKGWARGLKSCGYATNPTYAQQLITIIEKYELHQYDVLGGGDSRHDRAVHQSASGTTVMPQPSSREQAEELFFATHPVQCNNKNYYIVVQPGDNLPILSMMTNVSKRKLRRYNELPRKYQPVPGDILYLQRKRHRADSSFRGIPHVVQPGESMYTISQRYGIRLKSLYEMNALSDDYTPVPGHLLRVF